MVAPHEELEREFGNWMNYHPNQMVACSSGTAALHLALEALNRRTVGNQQANIIIPQFTMVACARSAVMAGMVPKFIDCYSDLLMDVSQLQPLIDDCTTTIMPVHIYGRRCDMNFIHKQAQTHNLNVVEDMAEAHGVLPHPETDAACWSFYKNKIVAGEEGGMIAFKDKYYAAKARNLRCLGFTRDHNFLHSPRGYNYRLANSLASLILDSLANVEHNLQQRGRVEATYNKLIPTANQMPLRNVCWVYDIRVPSLSQNSIVRKLNSLGVATRFGFRPMGEQEEFSDPRVKHTNAYKFSREIVYLPVDPNLSTRNIRRIAQLVITHI